MEKTLFAGARQSTIFQVQGLQVFHEAIDRIAAADPVAALPPQANQGIGVI
ncbi:MAG: hypothetical protein VCF07_11875 [Nitrospinota bacterium]